jgi:hypothetical protein
MQTLITPPTVSADAQPAKQILDLDSNTRVTFKPGKNHVKVYSEYGTIRLQLSEVAAMFQLIQPHLPA